MGAKARPAVDAKAAELWVRFESDCELFVVGGRSIPPSGLGWGLITASGPDQCDGSFDSFCGRSHTPCLLLGFNDIRGGLVFDGLSGWLILKLIV